LQVTEFHAKIPNHAIQRRTWLNLIIDLRSIFANLYRGSTYRSIERIGITGLCKVRKVLVFNAQQSQVLNYLAPSGYVDGAIH